MHRRTFSRYVAFSVSKSEHARLDHIARRFGFATLDALGADLFRIGLATMEESYVTTSRQEQFQRARARVGGRRVAASRRVA